MKAALKHLALALGVVTAGPSIANAQAVLPLEPAPLPQQVMPFQPGPVLFRYAPPPPPLPLTQYSFNGPSQGTVTFVGTRTTFYQPGPGGQRFASTTVLTPVFGYVPGYYRDYYTPLYFRP